MAGGSPPSARGGPPRRRPAGDDERTTLQDDAWEESTTIADDEAVDPVRPPGPAPALIQPGGTGEHTVDEPGPGMSLPTMPLRPAQPVVGSTVRATFIVEAGPDAGRRINLDNPRPSTIGRATDNDLVLADIAVSRKHVNLRYDGTRWLLRDRGSGNGTVVNGQLEENEVPLRSGDTIEIGNTVLRFEHLGTAMRGDGPDFSAGADDDARTVDGRAFRDGNAELVLPARPPGARPTQPPPMGAPAPAPGVVPVGIASTGPIAVRPTAALPAMAPLPRITGPSGVSVNTLRAGAAAPVPARDLAPAPEPRRTAPRTAPPPMRRPTAGAPTEPPSIAGNAAAVAALRSTARAAPPPAAGPPPTSPPPVEPTAPLPPLFAGPNVPPPAPMLGTMAPAPPSMPGGAALGALPAPRRRSHQGIPLGERGAPTMPIAPHQRLPVPGSAPAAPVRRRWVPWVIAGAALLLVGGAAAAVVVAFSDDAPRRPSSEPLGVIAAAGSADARPVAVDARPIVVDARPIVIDAAPIVADAAPIVVDARPAPDAAPVLTAAEIAARDAKARADKEAKERERQEREAKAERAADAALDKAEGQYSAGNPGSAAATVRSAMAGVGSKTKRTMASVASDYDQVARGLKAGTAGSAVEGLATAKKAIAADKRSGGALAGDLKKQLAIVAPKAALANLAAGSLEAAYAATKDASAAGAGGNATVRSVLTKLESEAGKLFTSGKSKLKSNRDAGLADLRRISKIVPPSSPWVAKASKAIADAGG